LGSFGLLAKGYALRPGTALPGWTNQTWYGPFQSDYQAWICPSDTGVVAGSPTKPFTSANLSYAYGEFRLTENVQPDTPIACDRSSQGNPTGVTPWSNNRGTHRSDGGNVLFADGHVASRKTMAPPMYDGKNP
jgi:prepilin-type processing-associated H-X9-DG protein